MKEITEKNIEKILEAVATSTSLASLAKNSGLPTYTVRYVLYKCLPKEQTQGIISQLANNRINGSSKPTPKQHITMIDTSIIANQDFLKELFALDGKLLITNLVADELNALKESNNNRQAQKLLATAAANKQDKFIFDEIEFINDVDTSLLKYLQMHPGTSLVTCDAGLAVRARTLWRTTCGRVYFFEVVQPPAIATNEYFSPSKEQILLKSKTSDKLFSLEINFKRTIIFRELLELTSGKYKVLRFVAIYPEDTIRKLYRISDADRELIEKTIIKLRE